jgi:abhydrolase domain-containing protein 5
MGLSSRQPFNIQNPEEVIDYFVESINEWRKSMNIQSFILAGHSFGGYISGMYFKKYHEFVEKLILISPLGMRAGTEEENLDTDK